MGVLKDLIRFDGCKEIVKVMEGQIIDLRKMNDQKDTIIKLHEANAINFRGIIANSETIIKNKDQSYADLNKKYRRSVRAGRFKVVLIVAAVAGGAYLVLK